MALHAGQKQLSPRHAAGSMQRRAPLGDLIKSEGAGIDV